MLNLLKLEMCEIATMPRLPGRFVLQQLLQQLEERLELRSSLPDFKGQINSCNWDEKWKTAMGLLEGIWMQKPEAQSIEKNNICICIYTYRFKYNYAHTRTDIYIYIHAPRLLVAPSPKVWHPPSVAMASPFPQDDPSHQLQISTSVPFSSPKKETFKKQQKNETIGTYIYFSSKTTRFFHQIFFLKGLFSSQRLE